MTGVTFTSPRTAAVAKSVARMSDRRELIYFDETPHDHRVLTDPRVLTRVMPDQRPPVVPSTVHAESDIPSPSYDVVILEEGFPSFAGAGGDIAAVTDPADLMCQTRSGNGRCQVVCFTSDHHALLSSAVARDHGRPVEVLSVRRAQGKITYLAGSESAPGAFVKDDIPEAAAGRLRGVPAPRPNDTEWVTR